VPMFRRGHGKKIDRSKNQKAGKKFRSQFLYGERTHRVLRAKEVIELDYLSIRERGPVGAGKIVSGGREAWKIELVIKWS